MDDRKPIKEIRVSDLLSETKRGKVSSVGKDSPIRDAIAEMLENYKTRKVYVLDEGGKLVGTITLETLLRYAGYTLGVREAGITSFLKMLAEIGDEKAAQVMVKPTKITANETIVSAARLMVENHLNDLPVVDDSGRLVAELNGMDLLRYAQKSW